MNASALPSQVLAPAYYTLSDRPSSSLPYHYKLDRLCIVKLSTRQVGYEGW